MGAIPNEGMFRNTPWHQLAEGVGVFAWVDAVKQGLGFTKRVEKVRMQDLILAYNVAADDEYAAVREDGMILKTGLGEQWTPFQMVDGYEFGNAIMGVTEGELESIGTMEHGRKWFLTYTLGEFTIGDFLVKDHLSVNGSFDSSWALQALSSPIVEVCENTIAMAKAAGTTHYKFKHTSGIFDRVEEAVRAVQIHKANREAFQAVGTKLLSTSVGNDTYKGILNKLFPIADDTPTKTRNTNENARELVNALYTATADVDADIVSGVRNTGWALVQAVNTYENWGQPIRKSNGYGEATSRAMRQIDGLVSGKQALTDHALELVLA